MLLPTLHLLLHFPLTVLTLESSTLLIFAGRGIVRGCGRPRGYGGSHAWGPGHGESRYCTVDEYQEVSGKLVLLYLSQSERSDSSK